MLQEILEWVIVFIQALLYTDPSVSTAALNAIWGGMGLLWAIGLHVLIKFRQHDLPDYVIESFSWARLTGLSVALHRTYWNMALWLAAPGESYHPFFVEHRGYLSIAILGIVVGTMKAVLPFLNRAIHTKVILYVTGILITFGISAALLTHTGIIRTLFMNTIGI